MKYFAATYTYGSDAQLVDDIRPTHREFIQNQLALGRIVGSGPYLDGGRQALIILQLPDTATQEDAEAILREDPYNQAGALTGVEIRPWNPVISVFGES